jgi:Fe2+ or Zn2+ uptake regulation protein
MAIKTWKPHPLSTVVIELLQRKGAATDAELYDMVKEIYGDLGFSALNKELMRLEIKGMVHVTALARGKRRVELVKKENPQT